MNVPAQQTVRPHGTREEDGRTHLIAMGGAALMEGFALIGFETWPDAGGEDVETVLSDLIKRHATALLLLEPGLAHGGTPLLQRVRAEGGRIVIAEVPPLQAPGDHHSEVEMLVRTVLGAAALEEQP